VRLNKLRSIRPKQLDAASDGLDEMYDLGRWPGIGGLATRIMDWPAATGDGHSHVRSVLWRSAAGLRVLVPL